MSSFLGRGRSGEGGASAVAGVEVFLGGAEARYELVDITTIGRQDGNSIQLADPLVSKRHAEIRRQEGGGYRLFDLESLNGSWVRGRRVTEHDLRDGDEVQIGSARLRFHAGAVGSADLRKVSLATDPGGASRAERVLADQTGEFLPAGEIEDEAALRLDYERLRVGHELSRAVASELDLRKLLPKILEKSLELLPADRAVILLADHDGAMIPSFALSRSGASMDEIKISRTVVEEVRNRKAAILSFDATADARFSAAASVLLQGIRSTMTVPLLHRTELLGIIHLDSQVATHAFTEKDLQVFTGIASEAAAAIQNARLVSQIEQETATRLLLSRLIPPAVVDQVVSGDLTLEAGGRLHEVTMLFADIRGFTQMSDGSPPQEILTTLNDHFELMVEVLFRHGGSVDKFVGDEIIGLFGAPVDLPDAPYRAVCCALDMVGALEDLNRLRVARGQKPVRVGIGINTGEVVTGALGSRWTVQYTAIGDPMNVASRLVGMAAPEEILISEETHRRIRDRVLTEPLPPVRVKGKAEELSVFRVRGLVTPHDE